MEQTTIKNKETKTLDFIWEKTSVFVFLLDFCWSENVCWCV